MLLCRKDFIQGIQSSHGRRLQQPYKVLEPNISSEQLDDAVLTSSMWVFVQDTQVVLVYHAGGYGCFSDLELEAAGCQFQPKDSACKLQPEGYSTLQASMRTTCTDLADPSAGHPKCPQPFTAATSPPADFPEGSTGSATATLLQLHASANIPHNKVFKRPRAIQQDHIQQLHRAIHIGPARHGSTSSNSSHKLQHTHGNDFSVPVSSQRQTSPFAACAKLHLQPPVCRHTLPPQYRLSSHLEPHSVKLASTGTPPWRGPGTGFAREHQPSANSLSGCVGNVQADMPVSSTLDLHMPQVFHPPYSTQAHSSSEDDSQSDESVSISPLHRQAWDWSHGSLQSFKTLRQGLQHHTQQTLQAALSSISQVQQPLQDADQSVRLYNSCQRKQREVQHKWADPHSIVPERQQLLLASSSTAQQPIHDSSSPPHYSLACFTSDSPRQPARCSQHTCMCSSFASQHATPHTPSLVGRAAATMPLRQHPAPLPIPYNHGIVTEDFHQGSPGLAGQDSATMSHDVCGAAHAAYLADLQHSTLDWMAANLAGGGLACRQI